jgi:pimeloyl-ACP methyl ester carboxylesterase
MAVPWEMVVSGPPDAEHTALLLPGGMCSARSWADVMAEPVLDGVRLVAVTMPGNAGAPAPDDFSVEHYARITAELAQAEGADIVVGFSMGANVAYEMAVSGAFEKPMVLLGLALSAPDEPAFFRAAIRLTSVLRDLPMLALRAGVPSMLKKMPMSAERKAELADDFRRNNPRDMRLGLQAYLRWLHRDDDPARRLCASKVQTWVVHAEKGDGDLTPHEREVLEACPTATVVTVPGNVFLLPNEVPDIVARYVSAALTATA